MGTLSKSPIDSFLISKIIYEENLPALNELIIEKLGFSFMEILENGKNNYKGIVFTKRINGVKVDLNLSFYIPEYGYRSVQLRTKSRDTFMFLNKELIIDAYKNIRDDGQIEYESQRSFNNRTLYMHFVSFESGELAANIMADSHFSFPDEKLNYYKDELKEVKEIFKKRRWFNKL